MMVLLGICWKIASNSMRVLGLMSGTSCDGLDCCDVEIDINYNFQFNINNFDTILFSDVEKSFLLSCRERLEENIAPLETHATKIFIEKINSFTKTEEYDFIACHGQTVKHIDKVLSLQLLDYKLFYKTFGKPVVYDFRTSDIYNNGTGAPLMPFLDWLLFKWSNKNIITLNIGGISNVSYIPKGGSREDVVGFDTGPGMSLLDRASNILFNLAYDIDGAIASKGNVNSILLEELMQNNFVNKRPPKSTDTKEFGDRMLSKIIMENEKILDQDLIKTLTQYTVESIGYNISKFINLDGNDFVLVHSGGGACNSEIILGLKNMKYNLESISSYGIDSSIKEALLIAFLGACRVKGISSNMPSVTGAKSLSLLGEIYNG